MTEYLKNHRGLLRFTTILLCAGLLAFALYIKSTEFVIGALIGYFGTIVTNFFGQHTEKTL